MQDITPQRKTLFELLSPSKPFDIDFYQREYSWEEKQVDELIDDLYEQFSQGWGGKAYDSDRVKNVKYFLGTIVVSEASNKREIVDGQQRLTTMTLLLINLSRKTNDSGLADDLMRLVYGRIGGNAQYKLNIPERRACMDALRNNEEFNPAGPSLSDKNLIDRFEDIGDAIKEIEWEKPHEFSAFCWWLMHNVHFIEISASSTMDAYKVFETMNDRGMPLTQTDMLKGYLLARIKSDEQRQEATKMLKHHLSEFRKFGKKTDEDFFKAWLRSQYATTIRENKRGAKPKDFDEIGTEYHRWVGNADNREKMPFAQSDNIFKFVRTDLHFYAELYVKILKACESRESANHPWASIRYNADAGITLQDYVLMAGIKTNEQDPAILTKIGIIADFLDCWLTLRIWNYRSVTYNNIRRPAFSFVIGGEKHEGIRGKSAKKIRKILHGILLAQRDEKNWEEEKMRFTRNYNLTGTNSRATHRILARLSDWLETESDIKGKYEEYVARGGSNPYTIEHILPKNHDGRDGYDYHRAPIGSLLLLRKKDNTALANKNYRYKLKRYVKFDYLLAKSLHQDAYESGFIPGFRQLPDRLPLEPHNKFGKAEIEKRGDLYAEIAEKIWSPDAFLARTSRYL
ncbi:MAG: DUF262 domain-containing HNH endonuclease family protein [Proteobacteria bacterium]|nr:DUF262 domain-containing HNH endonuclease family protein [Pseudomonadota bacterium]